MVSAAKTNSLDALAVESEMRAQVQKLTARIAELERSNLVLRRSNQDLERLAFAASHDLQEPLRMISTYAQLLANKYRGLLDEDSAMFVGNIVDGASQMRDVLADLLAYTDLSVRAETVSDPVDLNHVVEVVQRSLQASIDETCAVITRDELPHLSGYERDFVSLFQNLISNAIKYRSGAPPHIAISVQRGEGEFTFAVSDNGAGIEPRFHKEIFEPFKRLHSRMAPGTGLGLAICQRVVDRYGGRIWVESNVGHGAMFLFTIPDPTRDFGDL